ncbi:hypothetical protein ACOKM5_42920 [Streptomyces sp. BH097]|uniref:hypothetical protein n=1 Tax=unclassified Streptomyces TaxID=2593676 RepID=UPI003BB72636
MSICTHRPGYHHNGETCRTAAELKPGDRIPVLDGAALATVLDARPAEDGWMSVLLDASGDGAALIASDTVLSVRPADGLRADELPAPDPEVEVRVSVEVTEEVIYEQTLTLSVPASATADDAALLAHLADRWTDFDAVIESGTGLVNDQALTGARIVRRKATA